MDKIPGYIDLINYFIFMDEDEFSKIIEYYADAEMVKEMRHRGVQKRSAQAPYIIHAIYTLDRDCYPDKEIERLRKKIRDGLAEAKKDKRLWPFREEDNFKWTKEY